MINAIRFGKNAVINRIVSEYDRRAIRERIDFQYSIVSPTLLTMSDSDLTYVMIESLNALFSQTSEGVFLKVNVFSGKIQIECKSAQRIAPVFRIEEVEDVLRRNDGMLKTKYCNNKFVIQIVFPI